MAKLLKLVLFLSALAVSTFTGESAATAQCSSHEYGQSCSLQSRPESITVLNDKILVGIADHLVSFPLALNQVDEDVDVSSDAATVQTCSGLNPVSGELGNQLSECKNFIRVIQSIPNDNRIMVCGTNAFFPKCTLHNRTSLSVYTKMTAEGVVDAGFSPHSNASPVTAVLASNGRFFSATNFEAYLPQRTIGMAPRALEADSSFSIKAPTSDPLWFKQPVFVSTYEIGDYIYYLIKEAAYEVDMGDTVIYSRAIRICKDEEGISYSSNRDTMFRTFQKARMTCSFTSGRGSIPYYYNNLQSTFLWESTDENGQTRHILYAIFASQVNGPKGSAICKFSFDSTQEGSLTKVFENGDYLVPVTPDSSDQILWERTVPGAFSCPGSVRDPQNHQLVASPVTAMEPEPLHVISGETLNKITVDVIQYRGQTQEVIYFSTENGQIKQVVRIAGDELKYVHTILDAENIVSNLIVHKNTDQSRYLYATTDDRILSITRGNCAQYDGCFACLDSGDAYCGWDNGRCVNKISTDSPTLTQSFSADENTIIQLCGSRPPRPTPSPPPPESTCAGTLNPQPAGTTRSSPNQPNTDPTIVNCSTSKLSTSFGIDNNKSAVKQFSIPVLAGATVGAFIVGVPVGAIVCLVFFKLFVGARQGKKGTEEVGDPTSTSNGRSVSITQVNNLLTNPDHERIQKKEILMLSSTDPTPTGPPAPPRYVQVQPNIVPVSGPIVPMHKHSNSKDINEYQSPEEDDDTFTSSERDHVPPLRSITTSAPSLFKSPTETGGVSRKKVPGYKLPRGRTESTTWLRANSVSESSDLSSPGLESPISDV